MNEVTVLALLAGVLVALAGFMFRKWPNDRVEEVVVRSKGEGRFKRLVEDADALTALVDYEGKVRFANRAFGRILGYVPETLNMTALSGIVHPQDGLALRDALGQVLAGMGTQDVRVRWKQKSGQWVATEAKVWGLPAEDGTLSQAVVQARDVRAGVQLQEALSESKQRFEDFAANSADWLWEVNERGKVSYASPAVRQVLSYTAEEVVGRTLADLIFENPEDSARELVEARMDRREPFREIEFWSKTKLGERVYLHLSAVPIYDENKVFIGYRGVASNMTALQEDRENMFRLATTDHLTGLLNRPRFKEELERAVTLARRHNTQGMVLLIDLDRFKEINDTHGHEAGDAILVAVTEILRESVRSTDVLARLGGDEFAIIMHNIGEAEARAKVERIIDRIAKFALEYHGMRLTVTMSAGMVQYPQTGEGGEKDIDRGADHLLMAAELAMYRAKDMGRNRLFLDVEDAGLGTKDSVRAQLLGVERLRHCLEKGDFKLYYQPIVGAKADARPLFECLLRIFDAEGKMLSPALYIDAAEHFGLIQKLDLAVVRRAFETQKALQKKKVAADFSVNLSCRSLGDPDFMEKVKALLEDIKIDPAHIIFEVTETMALHDPAQMRDIAEIEVFVTELRKTGFRFALDDFGTGFTSFRYLKLLPVDLVKIDGEYIKDLLSSPEDRLFVESMVGLCRGLGILTVAEFVEDEAITREILALGIDYGQGWHFGKPLPDIEDLAKQYADKVMSDWLTKEGEAKLVQAVASASTAVPARKAKAPAKAKKATSNGNGHAAKKTTPAKVRKSVVAAGKKTAGSARKTARN